MAALINPREGGAVVFGDRGTSRDEEEDEDSPEVCSDVTLTAE